MTSIIFTSPALPFGRWAAELIDAALGSECTLFFTHRQNVCWASLVARLQLQAKHLCRVCVWETLGECVSVCVYLRVWLTASALWTNSFPAAPDTCEFLVTSFWGDFKPIYTLIKEWNQWVKTKKFLLADSIASSPPAVSRTCWSWGLLGGHKHFWKHDVVNTVERVSFYTRWLPI